ncbi:MAG: hypothetical protein AB7P04_10540 [Bacteriovoracia bacterium]
MKYVSSFLALGFLMLSVSAFGAEGTGHGGGPRGMILDGSEAEAEAVQNMAAFLMEQGYSQEAVEAVMAGKFVEAQQLLYKSQELSDLKQ